MDRQCKNLGWELYNNDIESTGKQQLEIAEIENRHNLDIGTLDLKSCNTVIDVIDMMMECI
jgi:hypothetical protein